MVLDPFPLWSLVSSSVNETAGLEDVLLLWRKFLWSLLQRYEKGRRRMQSGGAERGRPEWEGRESPVCSPQPAPSSSAAFCVLIRISSPSAMPADYYLPSFLSHACLQVVFNGQLTMSRGQRCKRKCFPVGAISHWREAHSWPRAHILSPACAPSVHRNGHFKQKWSSKTIYWL